MSGEIEYFLTIEKVYGPEELKEKGSRFISYLYPVTTAEEADAVVSGLRKEFHDATHVCYAFRLGGEKEEYSRFSDDGEPGGTAGLPIYNEIKKKDYFNVLAVVIRYYGGTKLGTGGLARAYGGAAGKVIALAQTVTIYIKKEISFDFPHPLTGDIMQMVNRFSLDVLERQYTANGVSIKLAIPIGRVEKVAQALSDLSSGTLEFMT